MIYTRTASDVSEAKKIIKEKVQKNIALTDAEIETLERGTITVNTLNRIETKQQELVHTLNSMGYYGRRVINKAWSYQGIFDESEFVRITSNNSNIRAMFYPLENTPANAIPKYNYQELNRLEKILQDLYENALYAQNIYPICGTFECGG